MDESYGSTVNAWVKQVQRVRLGRTVKSIAVWMSTFANPDGTSIYPGLAKLAVIAEVDYKTAKRAVADLVAAGLLEQVGQRGGGSRGAATEYRLIIHPDVLERAEVLNPAQFESEVERVRATNRRVKKASGTGAPDPRTPTSVQGQPAPVLVPVSTVGTGNGTSANGRGTGNGTSAVRGTAVGNTLPRPSLVLPTPPTIDLRADVTAVGPAPPQQRKGNGFCLDCYSVGKFTVAVDEVDGATCAAHQRARVA